jgi:hypothetical protein
VTAIPLLGALLVAAGCADTNVSAVEHERAAAAAKTRNEAERHQAAARELRATEQQLCAGIPLEERDLGPFAHHDQLERVEPLLDRAFAKAPPNVPSGATVHLRATPGVTVEWLQRVIDCHLAHHAVVGATPASHASPMFAPEPPEISVRSTGGGFIIIIRSSSLYADEVLRRARALEARVP